MPTARPHAKFVVLAYQLTSIMVRLVRSESEAAVSPVWPSRLVASLAAEAPMTRRIAIALSKGGVGKSTTAVSVAAGLARAGARVLLVDTDTQGQVSGMLGRHPAAGLAELLAGEHRPEEAIVEARAQLWLLAGGRTLAGMKRLIDRKDFGGEQTLGDTLAPLEGRYDYIILDTAPGWDVLSVNVLFYAAEILAPIALEVLSLQSLLDFQKSLAAIQRYNPALTLRYVVPTFLDRRVRKSAEILAQLRTHFGPQLCAPIRYNVRLSEAPGYGQTIFEYAPGSAGAQDYQHLVERIRHGDTETDA
jgi:chromosome partitioning protein